MRWDIYDCWIFTSWKVVWYVGISSTHFRWLACHIAQRRNVIVRQRSATQRSATQRSATHRCECYLSLKLDGQHGDRAKDGARCATHSNLWAFLGPPSIMFPKKLKNPSSGCKDIVTDNFKSPVFPHKIFEIALAGHRFIFCENNY